MESKVTRAEWHAAMIRQHEALGIDATTKAKIATGEKWPGADISTGHAVTVARNEEARLKAEYDQWRKPQVKTAVDAVKSANGELADKTKRRGELLSQVA